MLAIQTLMEQQLGIEFSKKSVARVSSSTSPKDVRQIVEKLGTHARQENLNLEKEKENLFFITRALLEGAHLRQFQNKYYTPERKVASEYN